LADLAILPSRRRDRAWLLERLQLGVVIVAWFALAQAPAGVGLAATQEVVQITAGADAVVVSDKPDAGTAALTGVVVDAVTGAQLPGAAVSLGRASNSTPVTSVLCDSSGRFVFTRLPAGTFTLTAGGHGYVDSFYVRADPDDGPPRQPDEIPLKAGQWRTELRIRLWRLGSISGFVVDEVGEPLVGVAVRAFTHTTVLSRTYLAGSDTTTTDDRGWYRLKELTPGSYVVGIINSHATVSAATADAPQRYPVGALARAGEWDSTGTAAVRGPTQRSPGGHRLVLSPLTLLVSGDESSAYRAVFYPSSPTPADAQPVSIGAGEHHLAVDFRLEPIRTFRVSGSVGPGLSPDATPLLRLLPRGFEELGLGSEVATTVVDAAGSFTFLSVPPGQYTLLAQSAGLEFVNQTVDSKTPDPAGFVSAPVALGTFPGSAGVSILERRAAPAAVWGRASVDVGNGNIADLTLTFRPTASVRGRVVVEPGSEWPAAQSQALVTATPANGDPLAGSRAVLTRVGPAAGSFSIDGLLPGVYLLRGSGLPVKSVTWRGRDVSDAGVDLTMDQVVDDVVITLTSKVTEVSGSIIGGDLDRGASVIVFPVDRAMWANYGWVPRRLRSVPARADGSFSFRNLPAGDYFVVAVDSGLANAWVEPRFLESASAVASKISLAWDGRVLVNVPLRSELRK
jgi:Carboxypeptidase regulatory-like domain